MRREVQKQNIMSSENESMLVSERRPIETLIKTNNKCECTNFLKSLETKLQILELRFEQISANLNICFTKHIECYGKLVDQQKKRQNLEYVTWEMKEISQAVQEKINIQILKQQESLGNLNQEVQTWARVLREMKSWKSSYGAWSSGLEKNLYDNLKNYRQENDEKLRKMYEAVEQIGLLQRKMLQKSEYPTVPSTNNTQPQKKSRAISYNGHNDRQSLPIKKSMGHNDSTMLYSRHCYK